MNLMKVTPMLWVKDVNVTMDYYINVLGFSEAGKMENGGWGSVMKDDVEFMFTSFFESQRATVSFPGTFYLYTKQVDEWWDLLKDKADIFYPIEDFDYGMREFAIKDCNGFILQFGSDIIKK